MSRKSACDGIGFRRRNVFSEGGANLYNFVRDNGISMVDYQGLEIGDIWGGWRDRPPPQVSPPPPALFECFDKCKLASDWGVASCKAAAHKCGKVMGIGGAIVGFVIGAGVTIEGGPGAMAGGAIVGGAIVGGVNYLGWGGGTLFVCLYGVAAREAACNYSCALKHGR